MSQFKSFFISAFEGESQCEELNAFLKSHSVIRMIENCVSSGQNCGVQILIEYKESGEQNPKSKRVDYRSLLKNDAEKKIFDKLKTVRANLAKEKKLVGAYMVCKDEHLAKIVQKPDITIEEIKEFPNSSNIMLKDFAMDLLNAYRQILSEQKSGNENANEEDKIPF